MQPNQRQPETDQWQQPTPAAPAAPYQAPSESVSAPEDVTPPAEPTSPASESNAEAVNQPQANDVKTESNDIPQTTDPAAEQIQQPQDDEVLLRWEGTEYIHSTRSTKWYVLFGIAVLIAILLAILVLKSVTFAILVPVMALALVMYVRRPPEVLQYTLSRKGLHINDKLYGYDTFKAFGVISHEGNHSIVLIPRKRFYIGQTIYFPEEIGEQVVDMLAARLPMKEVAPDAIDRLLAKLHL